MEVEKVVVKVEVMEVEKVVVKVEDVEEVEVKKEEEVGYLDYQPELMVV